MARTLSRSVDEAIAAATLTLLEEQGFANMSMEGIASTAGVGKPALYRRFRDKAQLAVHAINSQLPHLEAPDLGDTRRELWQAMNRGFPVEAPSYVGLIGGLMAERKRHPELIEAFRESVLGPRREIVMGLIQRGQARGDIRSDIEPVEALDLLAGPLLARAFAGADTETGWRERSFATWWRLV